jgi:L-lysine exporter family protein LysE/ArgO
MSLLIPLLQGFLLSLSLCFDLGVVNTAIIKTGIEHGGKPSFAIGFGSCFGDLLYMSLALLGVGAVFDLPAVRLCLWLVGTAALLALAGKSFREARRPKPLPQATGKAGAAKASLLRCWLTGAGLAMASPTSIAWFAVVAGPIAAGMSVDHGFGLVLFVAGFFAAGMLWSLSVAWISAKSGAWAGPKLVRIMSIFSALLFLAFAVKLFWDGWQTFSAGSGAA